MQANSATTPSQPTKTAPVAPRRLPMCYFCSSTDTMEPFRRDDHITLLSVLFPRLRWRFCRHCGRHFLHVYRATRHTRIT